MALELLRFPGFKDGDKALSVAVTANYVGGQPMAAYTDGVAASAANENFLGMALNDRYQDAETGKVGITPRGSEGILRPSLNPPLDKLIIAKGISAGDASFGFSNNKAFAQTLPVTVGNPAPVWMDPTALGVTKVYPYDSVPGYTAGAPMYVKTASGQWTSTQGDSTSTLAHGTVISKVGDALQIVTY